MEVIIPFTSGLRRQWRRRGYNRLSPTNRRNMKVARFGASPKRSWRMRLAPKLRLIRLATSPVKLWFKLKSAYTNTMLRLTANSGSSSGAYSLLGAKTTPKATRSPSMGYSRTEFENRLIFEIYKSMVASFELGYRSKLQS